MADLFKNRNPEDVRELGCMINVIGFLLLGLAAYFVGGAFLDYKNSTDGGHFLIKYPAVTFKATTTDWQDYEDYLDQGDKIEVSGIGNVLLKFEFEEKKVKLSRLNTYQYSVPSDGHAKIRFVNLNEEAYCVFEVTPVGFLNAEKKRDLYLYGLIGLILFYFLVVLPIGSKLNNYRSVEEKQARIKRKIGLE